MYIYIIFVNKFVYKNFETDETNVREIDREKVWKICDILGERARERGKERERERESEREKEKETERM